MAVGTTEELAIRLLQATREQLHYRPTREVHPIKAAEKAEINPYRIEYAKAVEYLLDHGYVEPYPHYSPGLYRVTNKGLEEILSSR